MMQKGVLANTQQPADRTEVCLGGACCPKERSRPASHRSSHCNKFSHLSDFKDDELLKR